MTTAGLSTVLFVCTANVCRSPMAQALLSRHLGEMGVAADVSSAGLLFDGRKPPPEVVEVMAQHGLDLSGHRSRLLNADMVSSSDLVIGMAREHVREVVVLDRAAFARTFTLRELVRRIEATPASAGAPGDWMAAVGHGRAPADLLASSPKDDVADPIGRPLSVYRATADELDGLCRRLAGALRPLLRSAD